jgi:aminomethyltransferase
LPRGVLPGERVRVVVRDKELAAAVVKPPFARNGKVLVQ